MTDYDHVPPRTVATLKFRALKDDEELTYHDDSMESGQMNTRTLEITIPDNYTADEVREHLAKLPVKKPKPGTVASNAYHEAYRQGVPHVEIWAFVESACREGYVEKDKIEAALAKRSNILAGNTNAIITYRTGYTDAWIKLSQLIREAMK